MPEFTKQQLEAMSLKELKQRYTAATGKTTKSPNKKFLINSILDAQVNGVEPDPDQQFADHSLSHAPEDVLDAAAEAVARGAEDLVQDDDEQPMSFTQQALARGKQKVADEKQDATTDKPKRSRKAKADSEAKDSDGLKDLDTETLQKLYEAEIGRPTGSSNTGYLIWKIREARKGNIKIGPAKVRTKSAVPMKVIPIRIEEDALAALDDLIGEGKPHKSRMEIFRAAITVWADMAGHTNLSNLIVGVREEASNDAE